jgi:AsmA protein
LLKALHKPGYASGNMEIRADLKGTGDSPHAIAATLDGAVGVAMAKGQIDSQVLGGLMSGLLQQTQIANLANKAGMSELNCFALRLDARNGQGTVRALMLDSSTLGMTGTGGMNFGNETLDLHLKPTVGVAGTTIAAPVIVDGTFANPSTKPDAAGLVTGNVGAAAKLALGASTGGIGLIIGSAVEQKLEGDVCAAPLALARFSQAPTAASSSTSSSTGPSTGSSGGTTAAPSQQKSQSPLSGATSTLKKLFQ